MNKYYYTFLIATILNSCSIITETNPSAVSKNAQDIVSKVNSEKTQAKWVHLKGRLQIVKGSSFEKTFNIIINNKKDSIILVSVRAVFGVEIIRAQITPDSVCVINRLDKTYLKTKITDIKDLINFDLSFYDFQDIIVGGYKIVQNNYKLALEGKDYYLKSDSLSYCISNKYKVKNARVLKNNNVVELLFDNYQETDSFPRKIVVKFFSEEALQATIKYSKVELNKQQEMVFTIPGFYEKIK
tara:strand:+ start:597 stop:1322 length:726 start_codon:yes stop_codon:yes gene_type:complete